MARIRTIKPEFPISETIGRLSRDARLLYIQLWTIADDSGRARASSRLLASHLYPYDEDSHSLIDGWLSELQAEGCVTLYEVDGTSYLEMPKWLKHQKIDRPTPSRLPPITQKIARAREGSRPLPRTLDHGPSTKDLKEVVALSATTDPVKEAVSDWNLLADRLNLPKVERLSPARRKKWLANFGNGSADRWSRVLSAVADTPFCLGEGPRGWRANFDFVVTAAKIDKLLEGDYLNDPNGGKSEIFKVAERMANEYENEEVGISDQTSDNSAKALWERNRDSSLSGDISGRVGAVLGNPTERGDSEGAEGLEMVPDSHGAAGGSKGNEEDQG